MLLHSTLVLPKNKPFAFQKYTVYTYSVAIDTNIYKETSGAGVEQPGKKPHKAFLPPSDPPSARAAVNSPGVLQNTIEEHQTHGAKQFPPSGEVWNRLLAVPTPSFYPCDLSQPQHPPPNPTATPRWGGQGSAVLQRGKCCSQQFVCCL